MPIKNRRVCCIPWCITPGKSKFRVPKNMMDIWEECLNFKLKTSDRVCELHFYPDDIIRTREPGDNNSKTFLQKPRLQDWAIPKHCNRDGLDDDILFKSIEFLNFPSSNKKKKERRDYRNILHDHSYYKDNSNSFIVNQPTTKTPMDHTNNSSQENLMLSNITFSEPSPKKIKVESPVSTTSKNINLQNNSLPCAQTEVNKLLYSCSCCLQGIYFGNLIQCYSCNKMFHYLCHVPSITQIKIKNSLNKSTNSMNITYKPGFTVRNLSNWKCTLCIDLNLPCKKISQKVSSNMNYSCERAVMKYILLKLYCQTNDSVYFRTCPDKQLFPSYYDKIKNPIALDDIKTKLESKKAYKLFLNLIQDVKLLISNATNFYSKNSNEYNSAINLQTTFRIILQEVCDYLIKFTPKNQTNMDQNKDLYSATSLVINKFFSPEVKSITTKPFSESDIKYLIEMTNNFMREDMFNENFLKFLIKDRFKDRTQLQLLHKLRELKMKYKSVNNNISNSLSMCQPLQTIENVYTAKPQPSINNLIETKKCKSYSEADIEYLCQKMFNYNSELILDDFSQYLVEDCFNDLTISELCSKLLLLENNDQSDLNSDQNCVNFDCIRI